MQAATNAAILDAASAAEGLEPAVVNIDLADGRPAITGISFCHDQFVFFDLGEVCGNGPPAAKRARLEELVRALASEAREARDATPNQSVTQGPVGDAALLCDETLDDDSGDDEETVGDEAGYESPEPTPMSPSAIARLLQVPEKERP